MTGSPGYSPLEIDILLQQSVERADIGYIVVDNRCRVLVWNKWMERASGKSRPMVIGVPLVDVFPEIIDSRLEDALNNALERGMAGILSAKLHRAPPLMLQRVDGEAVPLTNPVIVIRPLDGASLQRNGCLIQIIDETNSAIREKMLRSQAIALRAQEEQLRTLFEAINDSVLLLDISGLIVAANDTACLRLRGAKSAILGSPLMSFLPESSAGRHQRHFSALIRSGAPQRFEDTVGDDTFLVSMFPVTGSDQKVHRVAVLASDITERKAFERRIFHLAHHDALTGLPNRAYLLDRLDHAIDLARRAERRLALMFLDLDHFKTVNDTQGHDSGDALLKTVANTLTATVRSTDTVARMGGDEFVIMLEPAGSDDDIARLAGKVIAALDLTWGTEAEAIHVTTSIGIAVFPGNGAEARLLMKAADTAMYVAKTEGRNTYRFFSEEMTAKTLEKLHLERDIRDAVSRGEFELHYQPKICFRAKKPCGVEALVRWRHPKRGLVSPAEFIPLAEETGIIVGLGSWVLEEVCKQIALWLHAGRVPVPVAINVSPKQLFTGNFVGQVTSCAERYNVPFRYIHIEITESAVMADPAKASAILTRLRNAGVSIAIDDFGTGYSSLSYLSRLPIDVIKIDRSFVAGLADRKENLEIINAIISMGRSLNMVVVAEGIETSNDVDVLTDASCHIGQGFLFAKPMRATDLEPWLDAQDPHHGCGSCTWRTDSDPGSANECGDCYRPGA